MIDGRVHGRDSFGRDSVGLLKLFADVIGDHYNLRSASQGSRQIPPQIEIVMALKTVGVAHESEIINDGNTPAPQQGLPDIVREKIEAAAW
jgi:hypothetical protein